MLGKSANRTPHLFTPGTKVKYYSDDTYGVVVELDTNLIKMGYTSTTCKVKWDDCVEPDVQWTNKLIIVNKN